MFNVGLPEVIVIVMILLVVFGASRLPKLGENLGRTVGKLKRGVDAERPADGESGSHDPEAAKTSDGTAQDAEIVD